MTLLETVRQLVWSEQVSGGEVAPSSPLYPAKIESERVFVPSPQPTPQQQRYDLGELIRAGWQRYGRSLGAWVQMKRTRSGQVYEVQLCALAAAYITVFHREPLERLTLLDDHKASICLIPAIGYDARRVQVPSVRRDFYGRQSNLTTELMGMNDEGYPDEVIIRYASDAGVRHLMLHG